MNRIADLWLAVFPSRGISPRITSWISRGPVLNSLLSPRRGGIYAISQRPMSHNREWYSKQLAAIKRANMSLEKSVGKSTSSFAASPPASWMGKLSRGYRDRILIRTAIDEVIAIMVNNAAFILYIPKMIKLVLERLHITRSSCTAMA